MSSSLSRVVISLYAINNFRDKAVLASPEESSAWMYLRDMFVSNNKHHMEMCTWEPLIERLQAYVLLQCNHYY